MVRERECERRVSVVCACGVCVCVRVCVCVVCLCERVCVRECECERV